MPFNSPRSEGCPPGFEAKRRVSGVLARLVEAGMQGSIAGISTELHRQAFYVAKYVLREGKFPLGPFKVVGDGNLWVDNIMDQVSEELTKRALRVGSGPAYGTPAALLTSTSWFPRYFTQLVRKYPEFKFNVLNSMRELYVVPNRDTTHLRSFAVEECRDQTDDLRDHYHNNHNAVIFTQGGGTGMTACYKESKMFPGCAFVNKEIDTTDSDLEEKIRKVGQPEGSICVNSQTQKGTLTNDEIMDRYQVPVAISIFPIKEPKRAGVIKSNNAKARFQKWRNFDDEDKFQRALAMDTIVNPPLSHCGGENISVVDFAGFRVHANGHYYKTSPDESFFQWLPGLLQKKLGNTGGTGKDLLKMLSSQWLNFKGKGKVSGDVVVKPKIDGVSHMAYSDGNQVFVLPRTFDEHRPFILAVGPSTTKFKFFFELTDDCVAHVYRVVHFGPFRFRTDSVQRNLALEASCELEINGQSVSFCSPFCKHKIDGVTISRGEAEIPWKDVTQYDSKLDHTVQGFPGLTFFKTTTHEEGHELRHTIRVTPLSSKKFQSTVLEAVTPSPTLMTYGNTGHKTYWEYKKGPRPRGFRFKLGIIDLQYTSCHMFEKGCGVCGKPPDEICNHGAFCHDHGCDINECQDKREDETCRSCDSSHTTLCNTGEYHCALHACPARKEHNSVL